MDVSTLQRAAADVVTCAAPATCGELIQGHLDGADFLVNCPIDLYARATAVTSWRRGLALADETSFGKARAAIEKLSALKQRPLEHALHIASDIPRGKGMASSTADISAAVAAFCHESGIQLADREFARLLAAIEPSDCVHFPGIAHVNHLTGELYGLLPAPRGLRVLVVDCGGEVDTLAFDRELARSVYRSHQEVVRAELTLLEHGLRSGDNAAVAVACTLSARLSQQILFKPPFDDLLACARAHGALGLNCAHSGTVLGVLYEARPERGERLTAAVRRHLGASASIIGDHRIIAGGVHVGA